MSFVKGIFRNCLLAPLLAQYIALTLSQLIICFLQIPFWPPFGCFGLLFFPKGSYLPQNRPPSVFFFKPAALQFLMLLLPSLLLSQPPTLHYRPPASPLSTWATRCWALPVPLIFFLFLIPPHHSSPALKTPLANHILRTTYPLTSMAAFLILLWTKEMRRSTKSFLSRTNVVLS